MEEYLIIDVKLLFLLTIINILPFNYTVYTNI